MNILVISPHPDDETLGAGGSLLRLKAEGNPLFWLNITDMSEDSGYNEQHILRRTDEIRQIKSIYGFSDFLNLKLAPATLELYDGNEIIPKISRFIDKIQAECILLPDFADAHSDHRKVFEWGMASTKIFRHPSVKRILTMEILSETNFGNTCSGFVPNYYIDITEYMDKKVEAACIYQSEIGTHPFPRSREALNALGIIRGSEAGVRNAEAFRVIKFIE